MDCGDNNLPCEFFKKNPSQVEWNGPKVNGVSEFKYDVDFENVEVYSVDND